MLASFHTAIGHGCNVTTTKSSQGQVQLSNWRRPHRSRCLTIVFLTFKWKLTNTQVHTTTIVAHQHLLYCKSFFLLKAVHSLALRGSIQTISFDVAFTHVAWAHFKERRACNNYLYIPQKLCYRLLCRPMSLLLRIYVHASHPFNRYVEHTTKQTTHNYPKYYIPIQVIPFRTDRVPKGHQGCLGRAATWFWTAKPPLTFQYWYHCRMMRSEWMLCSICSSQPPYTDWGRVYWVIAHSFIHHGSNGTQRSNRGQNRSQYQSNIVG